MLNPRERKVLLGLTGIFMISLAGLLVRGYLHGTTLVPAVGGTYTEGLVGQPRLINPLFVAANDADRDLVQLIFSGLTKYGTDGSLMPDLAERYEISPDGKTYLFYLREGITWHDGEPFTPDDIAFTLLLVQNPLVQSPLKTNWQGVKFEKLDERRVQFTLNTPYAPFLENTTLGILPKHLWEKVPLEGLRLTELNLQPIGTGPYMFERFRKDGLGSIHSFTLTRFTHATPTPPHLKTIVLRFFGSEEDLLKAFKSGGVEGFPLLTNRLLAETQKNRVHTVLQPRYFAVFFNQVRSRVLAEKTVRQALRDATDRSEIIQRLLAGQGVMLTGPLPPGLPGLGEQNGGNGASSTAAAPSTQTAVAELEKDGWKDSDGDGIREKILGKDKTPTPLAFTLSTSDLQDFRAIAETLKQTWSGLGIKVQLEFQSLPELERNTLRPRQYDALLFGEVLNLEPDPFAFWHSSQKSDPGLNLALYENRAVDRLLEEARQTLEKEKRAAKLQEFAKIVQEDIPAVFLYAPYFLYLQDSALNGFGMKVIGLPAHRFADITNWYVKTERAWKR